MVRPVLKNTNLLRISRLLAAFLLAAAPIVGRGASQRPTGGSLRPSSQGSEAGPSLTFLNGPGTPALFEVDPDPVNPRTLYIPISGSGVFKSTDDGNDWSILESTRGTGISTLAISPSDPARIYGVGNGLYLSTDGGQSWEAVNRKPDYGYEVAAIAVDPSDPNTIFIGIADGGMLKSTDGGKTTAPINNGLGNRLIYSLTLQILDGRTIAYIGTSKGFFKSKDGGESWVEIGGLKSISGEQLVIFAANPRIMYAVGASAELGVPFPVIDYTQDGGLNWQSINTWGLPFPSILLVDPTNPAAFFIAGGYGLLKTTDWGATWAPVGTGLNMALVNSLMISPSNPSVFYAATSSGFYNSTDGASTWTLNDAGLPGSGLGALAIDPADSQIEYGVGGGYPETVFKSTDTGQSWSQIQNGLTTGGNSVQTIFCIAIDPSNPANLFIGTDYGIFQSTNGGTNWVNVANPGGYSYVFGLAIDPTETNVIYAAFDSGLLKSTDGGVTWPVYAAGLPKHNSELRSVAIDPVDHITLYAGGENNISIFKSTDAGATWQSLNSGNYPYAWVTTVLVDPSNPQIIYAATFGDGLLRSTTGGDHWRRVPGLEPDAYVNDLKIDAEGTLYAATANGLALSHDGLTWSYVSSQLYGDWSNQVILGGPPNSAILVADSGIVQVSGISPQSVEGTRWVAGGYHDCLPAR